MILHSESNIVKSLKNHLDKHSDSVIENLLKLITVRADELVKGPDRNRVLSLMKRVVDEVHESLATGRGSTEVFATKNFVDLPIKKLKVSEIIEQGWVEVPKSSFYRVVDQKRFYGVTRSGGKIGKEFPAWQFVSPVPDLIEPILKMFDGVPDSEIHAFWVSEADELNSLSPAEVLAGLPFATRKTTFSSQTNILNAPVAQRASMVSEFAKLKLRNVADLIG
jgi:hypothetical protein